MSSKRGRKCSIKSCDNFQHTQKHLSFFRFPKDLERCRTWIENTKRFDLLDKINVHDERICQQHFESFMFLNESQNRLHQYAVPTLYLTSKPPPAQAPTENGLMINGVSVADHLFNNDKFNMSMVDAAAVLLSQNNLTITPVYSSKPKLIQNQTHSEPLNLSANSQNGVHSLSNSSVLNISNSTDGSPNNSILQSIQSQQSTQNQHSSIKTSTNGITAQQLNVNTIAKNTVNPSINTNGNGKTITNVNSIANTINSGGFRRPRQVFSMEQENQLADYVRETSNYYCGLSSKEVRIMAFVYGVCNLVEMPNGWHESHQASFDWCVGFIKRTKLPPTMITGISTKGSSKQSKSTTTIDPKLSQIAPQNNGNTALNTATPIEID